MCITTARAFPGPFLGIRVLMIVVSHLCLALIGHGALHRQLLRDITAPELTPAGLRQRQAIVNG